MENTFKVVTPEQLKARRSEAYPYATVADLITKGQTVDLPVKQTQPANTIELPQPFIMKGGRDSMPVKPTTFEL